MLDFENPLVILEADIITRATIARMSDLSSDFDDVSDIEGIAVRVPDIIGYALNIPGFSVDRASSAIKVLEQEEFRLLFQSLVGVVGERDDAGVNVFFSRLDLNDFITKVSTTSAI